MSEYDSVKYQSCDDIRLILEREIRDRTSEYTIDKIHEKVFIPSLLHSLPIKDAVLDELDGGTLRQGKFRRCQESIEDIRNLLVENAKERDLQNALIESGLLSTYSSVVAQEVSIRKNIDEPGKRMDITIAQSRSNPAQLIELKRSRHLILANKGKPAERLSKQYIAALNQVNRYAKRLERDPEEVKRIQSQLGICLDDPQVKLVAGKRLSSPEEYSYFYSNDVKECVSGRTLHLYTWDSFLDEIQRLVS